MEAARQRNQRKARATREAARSKGQIAGPPIPRLQPCYRRSLGRNLLQPCGALLPAGRQIASLWVRSFVRQGALRLCAEGKSELRARSTDYGQPDLLVRGRAREQLPRR